jgi:hypothetical protein
MSSPEAVMPDAGQKLVPEVATPSSVFLPSLIAFGWVAKQDAGDQIGQPAAGGQQRRDTKESTCTRVLVIFS